MASYPLNGLTGTHDEVWAVSYERVCGYFEAQTGVFTHGKGRYEIDGTEITLSPLPERRLGSLRIPQTGVRIEGGDPEPVYQAFRLRFLSAGG